MSTAIQLHQPEAREIAPASFTREQLDLLKRTVAKGADDDEFALFLLVCKRTGLDPFARQLCMVKRWSSTEGREVMAIQSTVDGFRVVSERSGDYAGMLKPEWCGEDGVWKDVWLKKDPPSAARVAILRHSFKEPLWATVLWSEFVVLKKDGITPTPFWKRMGVHMLAKCAESQARRTAFPQDLSGIYTDIEMMQAENERPRLKEPDGPATQKQRGYLMGLLRDVHQLDGKDAEGLRAALNAELQELGHAPITSSKQLTAQVASNVIEALKAKLEDATERQAQESGSEPDAQDVAAGDEATEGTSAQEPVSRGDGPGAGPASGEDLPFTAEEVDATPVRDSGTEARGDARDRSSAHSQASSPPETSHRRIRELATQTGRYNDGFDEIRIEGYLAAKLRVPADVYQVAKLLERVKAEALVAALEQDLRNRTVVAGRSRRRS